jgi:hypothetical protein
MTDREVEARSRSAWSWSQAAVHLAVSHPTKPSATPRPESRYLGTA